MVDFTSSSAIRAIPYKCAHCGAIDWVRLFPNESAPVSINCFKCHAGLNKKLDEMVYNKDGMFPMARSNGKREGEIIVIDDWQRTTRDQDNALVRS